MSSFVGHGLTALTIYLALHPRHQLQIAQLSKASRLQWLRDRLPWLAWLVAIAWTPALGDWVPWFQGQAGLRPTHSILASQILPLVTVLVLAWRGWRKPELLNLGLQASLAGLSHLVLDLAMGIGGLPLLWPLSQVGFSLPMGLLPSTGAMDLGDIHFYRNLLIELGVLLPLSFCVVFWRWCRKWVRGWAWMSVMGGAIALSLVFMHWSSQLSR